MKNDIPNKRIYKHRLKHWSIKPASAKVDRKKYSYKVVSAEDCKDHGVVSQSDLLKFAIVKFDGERFVEVVAWFSSEESAMKSVKKFPLKNVKKKKKVVREIREVLGLNTATG